MSAPAVYRQLPSIGRLHHVSRRYDLLAPVKGSPRRYLHPAVIEAGLERALGYFTSWAGWKPCLSMMPGSPKRRLPIEMENKAATRQRPPGSLAERLLR